ncbi:hypothetical protein C1645_732461 [Glomus cerebriforme]|uniref:Uncharacterized protein n=1 Tax=Glomus cerebriforme TaxID=658196 RepID=A0A397TQS2_9GLOM|nr:hypothetical protein C1645_732461 [Glomus cerebriforme]
MARSVKQPYTTCLLTTSKKRRDINFDDINEFVSGLAGNNENEKDGGGEGGEGDDDGNTIPEKILRDFISGILDLWERFRTFLFFKHFRTSLRTTFFGDLQDEFCELEIEVTIFVVGKAGNLGLDTNADSRTNKDYIKVVKIQRT